jgi:antitoxin (DNA-binding transcriptional repressor) of toxin-antitoxin stability system
MLKPSPSPVAISMEIAEIQDRLAEAVARVFPGPARVLVAQDGVPVAALVSPDDLLRLEHLDREWDETTRALERFSAAFADIPPEALETKIDEIIAEGRAQDARERRSA